MPSIFTCLARESKVPAAFKLKFILFLQYWLMSMNIYILKLYIYMCEYVAGRREGWASKRVRIHSLSLALSLSLSHTQRLTAFDLLLGVYSKTGGEKRKKAREKEGGRKRSDCYFPDVTGRRKTQDDWGKSIIVFYSNSTKCIGWIDKEDERRPRMKKTTKWWGIWFFASFYRRRVFSFFLILFILILYS